MTKQLAFANELRTTIWRTMGARFNAVRRLRRRDRLSTFSIAGFSVVAIGFTVLQKVYGVAAGTNLDNLFTSLAIFISLFVLVISLLEGAAAYNLKAERLHQNAVELDDLQKRLGHLISRAEDGEPIEAHVIDALNREYVEKIKQCPENHEWIDDLLFKAQHRNSPEFLKASITYFGALKIRVEHWFYSLWLFLIAWSINGLLIILVVSKLS